MRVLVIWTSRFNGPILILEAVNVRGSLSALYTALVTRLSKTLLSAQMQSVLQLRRTLMYIPTTTYHTVHRCLNTHRAHMLTSSPRPLRRDSTPNKTRRFGSTAARRPRSTSLQTRSATPPRRSRGRPCRALGCPARRGGPRFAVTVHRSRASQESRRERAM